MDILTVNDMDKSVPFEPSSGEPFGSLEVVLSCSVAAGSWTYSESECMRCWRLETDCVPSDGLASDFISESILNRSDRINEISFMICVCPQIN